MRLTAVNSRRDPQSRFLISEEIGPTVAVPQAIATAIWQALERQSNESLDLNFSSQEGSLQQGYARVGTASGNFISQPLSRWSLRLAEEDIGLHVQLSADLHATLPAPSFQKDRTVNFWADAPVNAPRITIDFYVDLVTRAVRFACYSSALFEWEVSDPPAETVQTTLHRLRLDCAPIGFQQGYGITPDNQWVSFGDGHDGISFTLDVIPFTRRYRPRRSSAGFLVGAGQLTEQTINLKGVNLDTANAMLTQDGYSCCMALSGAWIGHLSLPRALADERPQPVQSIIKALLEFRLDAKGLNLAYRLLVNDLHLNRRPYGQGWLEGSFILPWELLILRYPAFLRHRQHLPKAEP